ncbi:MAG: hypothetical protein ACI4SV_00275 [Duodenibacillus sp.]
MLDVQSTVDFSSRLFEALESARAPKGEGRVANDRGPVPREIAEAFRALMEGPDNVQTVAAAARPEAAAAAQSVSAASDSVRVPTSNAMPAAEGIGRSPQAVEAPLPTPEVLLQTQFAVNMHAFESSLTANTRDKFLSDFEQLLKSNG